MGAGMHGIIDTTPVKGFANNRVAEICDWLRHHPDVHAYVAIDDMDLSKNKPGGTVPSPIAHNVIRTKASEGLTAGTLAKVVALGYIDDYAGILHGTEGQESLARAHGMS